MDITEWKKMFLIFKIELIPIIFDIGHRRRDMISVNEDSKIELVSIVL